MKKPTRDELFKMPLGSKITTNSKEEGYQEYRKTPVSFKSEKNKVIAINEINEDLTLGAGEEYGTKIIKVEKPLYETVWEEKEILDEQEKKYLRAVIKPFRNKIKNITLKRASGDDYIHILLENSDDCTLPYFKMETMYKGMKVNKPYTLEELGL